MVLAADTPIREQVGDFNEHGVYGSSQIYEGAMVGLTSGYARGLTAGDPFVGHAMENVLGNGTNAGKKIKVRAGLYRLQVTLASVAVTDIGKNVYGSADGTYTLTQGSNSYVGQVVAYVTTNTCIVEFCPLKADVINHEHTTVTAGGPLTNPYLVTGVKDSAGNQLLGITRISQALTYVDIGNAASNGACLWQVKGSGTNGSLTLKAKGAGVVLLGSAATEKVGFFGTGGVVQQNHQADVTSGTVNDTNARTRIASILNTLEVLGLHKLS